MGNDDLFEGNVKEEKYFPKATVVRLMKQNIESDKSVSDIVKDRMNELMYSILKNICLKMDKEPYHKITLDIFEKASYAYANMENIIAERKRLLARLEAIEADIKLMKLDVIKTIKVFDEEEDDFDVLRFD